MTYLVALILTAHTAFGAEESCELALAGPAFEKQIGELALLKLNIERAQARGQNSPLLGNLRQSYADKEKELLELASDSMSRDELLMRLRARIILEQEQETNDQSTRQQQAALLEEFGPEVIDGELAVFFKIQPGSFFKMGPPNQTVSVHLSQPFYMMATPVTNSLYNRIVALAPDTYAKPFAPDLPPEVLGRADEHWEFNAKRPVKNKLFTQISAWIDFINQLSQDDSEILKTYFPGHKRGDIYRLPTEAEWAWMLWQAQNNDPLLFKSTHKLNLIAWNSRQFGWPQAHVATKQPLLIQGKRFYDLIGLVDEYMLDSYQENLPGGVNPVARRQNGTRVLRGGNVTDDISVLLNPSSRKKAFENGLYPEAGFRLVRIRPQ